MPLRVLVLLLASGLVSAAAPTVPVMTTFAGGSGSALGDGGPAGSANLKNPQDVAVDAAGNLYVADLGNYRVRKITPAGTISTVAGNGTTAYNGDGIAATSAAVRPVAVAVDAAGNLYIAESSHRIRKVTPAGIIGTVAGNGTFGYSGDGGPATAAQLYGPKDVEADAAGNLYIADSFNNRVRKVSSGGIITTVAGNGSTINPTCGCYGDGLPAVQAGVHDPRAVALDAAGNLYLADSSTGLRRVDRAGIIDTVAGGGLFGGDPMATNVALFPRDFAFDSRGNAYISHNNLVLMLSIDGSLHAVAGKTDESSGGFSGESGYGGDGGEATQARLQNPLGIAVDPQGNVLIADSANNRIRKVTEIPQPTTPPGMFMFRSYVEMPTLTWHKDVISGDVTGDGRDDLVFSATTGNAGPPYYPVEFYEVGIVVQRGDGTLADPVYLRREWTPTTDAEVLERGGLGLADFNGDGVKDIVVSHGAGIEIIPGSRTGNFIARSFSGAHNAPVDEVLVMDVNRDGKADVVAHTTASATDFTQGIGVYFGNGIGAVSSRSFMAVPFTFAGLAGGDLNGDGLTDVASSFSEDGAGGLAVFRHDPTDGFLPAQKYNALDAGLGGVAVGDFNRDGRKDAVVGLREYKSMARLSLFSQQASGLLATPIALRTAATPDVMLATDMNGDGADDLAVVHVEDWATGYYQQGAAGLAGEIKYLNSSANLYQTNTLTAGDINHDGYKDLITVSAEESLVLLYGTGRRTGIRMNDSQPLPRTHGGAAVPRVRQSVHDMHDGSGGPADHATNEAATDENRYSRAMPPWLRAWRPPTPRASMRGMLDAVLRWHASWKHFWRTSWLQGGRPGEAGSMPAASDSPILSRSSPSTGKTAFHPVQATIPYRTCIRIP